MWGVVGSTTFVLPGTFCPCLPTTSAHRGHAGPNKEGLGHRTGRGGAGGVAHRTSTPRHPRRQRVGTARRRSCRHPPCCSCSPRRLVQRSDRRIGESWQGKSCGTGVRGGRGRPVGEVGSENRQIKGQEADTCTQLWARWKPQHQHAEPKKAPNGDSGDMPAYSADANGWQTPSARKMQGPSP